MTSPKPKPRKDIWGGAEQRPLLPFVFSRAEVTKTHIVLSGTTQFYTYHSGTNSN